MNSQKTTSQKLLLYGVKAQKQSERSLQQKIIQMYELLEQKTTQNLLLRKQNDDIKLQIKTIDEVFTNAQNNIKRCLSNEQEQPTVNQLQLLNTQSKLLSPRNYNNTSQLQKDRQTGSSYPYLMQNKQKLIKKYSQNCQYTDEQSIQTQQNTPRYSSKPHRNSRFCSNPKENDKQKTSRMVNSKAMVQQKSTLDEKIELLMKQNQIILKRMNQIQVNFIKKSQQENSQKNFRKNYDDRSTNFSNNITSIQNIWAKKDNLSYNGGLASHNRTHYSTSNLRSYCPSLVD